MVFRLRRCYEDVESALYVEFGVADRVFPLFCDDKGSEDRGFDVEFSFENDLPCYVEGLSLFEDFDGQGLKLFEGQSSVEHLVNEHF